MITPPDGFDSDDVQPPDERPLTKNQVKYLMTLPVPEELDVPKDMIYIVRGVRKHPLPNNRWEWEYHGRGYNTRKYEILDTGWMGEHGMGSRWRAKTLHRDEKFWFLVPVSAKVKPKLKPIIVRRSPSSKPDGLLPPIPIRRTKRQKKPKPIFAACIADCLIKFFDHARMTLCSKKMKAIRRATNPSFGTCIQCVRSMKKFGHQKLISAFDPFHHGLKDDLLYLFQIRAQNIWTREYDNTHAICVHNMVIYDANNPALVDFNLPNLDDCCLGGELWRFDRVVNTAVFIPKPTVQRFIKKNLRNYV